MLSTVSRYRTEDLFLHEVASLWIELNRSTLETVRYLGPNLWETLPRSSRVPIIDSFRKGIKNLHNSV